MKDMFYFILGCHCAEPAQAYKTATKSFLQDRMT